MKLHVTASAVTVGTRKEDRATAGAGGARAGANNTRTQPGPSEPTLALATTTVRTHTLVLSGELDHRSAHTLEAEIERLCEEGVTGITLDLRELTYIDSIGVSVIAFRCELCKRRGYEFSLVPGPRSVQRAFEQAAVAELLPFQGEEVTAPRRLALVLGHRSRDDCEQ